MVGFFQRHGDTLTILAALVVAFAALATLTHQRFNAQERYVEQRFDAQDRYIEQRFDAQDRYIEQRFDAQDKRLDAQDKRLDNLTAEVSDLRKLLTGIVERVSRNEGEIDVIRQQRRTTDTPAP